VEFARAVCAGCLIALGQDLKFPKKYGDGLFRFVLSLILGEKNCKLRQKIPGHFRPAGHSIFNMISSKSI